MGTLKRCFLRTAAKSTATFLSPMESHTCQYFIDENRNMLVTPSFQAVFSSLRWGSWGIWLRCKNDKGTTTALHALLLPFLSPPLPFMPFSPPSVTTIANLCPHWVFFLLETRERWAMWRAALEEVSCAWHSVHFHLPKASLTLLPRKFIMWLLVLREREKLLSCHFLYTMNNLIIHLYNFFL